MIFHLLALFDLNPFRNKLFSICSNPHGRFYSSRDEGHGDESGGRERAPGEGEKQEEGGAHE